MYRTNFHLSSVIHHSIAIRQNQPTRLLFQQSSFPKTTSHVNKVVHGAFTFPKSFSSSSVIFSDWCKMRNKIRWFCSEAGMELTPEIKAAVDEEGFVPISTLFSVSKKLVKLSEGKVENVVQATTTHPYEFEVSEDGKKVKLTNPRWKFKLPKYDDKGAKIAQLGPMKKYPKFRLGPTKPKKAKPQQEQSKQSTTSKQEPQQQQARM